MHSIAGTWHTNITHGKVASAEINGSLDQCNECNFRRHK